jgi:MoaA/NifB/PqqE/SkfB family radical SAM enzyme
MHSEPVASATATPIDDAIFDTIGQLVNHAVEELDNPTLWEVLEELAGGETAAALDAGFSAVAAKQFDPFAVKLVETLGATFHALAIDKDAGLARLHALAHAHAHCPQIAGALFYVARHGTEKSADLSNRFCEAPFVKFETLIDGNVAPCCSIWTQHRLGHLERDSFDTIWNGPDAQAMRGSILDGSYRYCNKQRCTLIMEDALPLTSDVTDPDLRDAIDNERTVMKSPKWLFLAHDITCNLACPSCRSELLGSDEAQEARFAIIENEVFHPLLNADGEVLVSISGQGDPWSSQHYRSILRYMADHELNARLNIHTNALLMSERKWEEYKGLERYDTIVDVSIDACSPHVYRHVRRPGKWEKLEPNLRFIARKRAAGTFREFHINATVQLDNFHELPGLVDFGADLGVDSVRLYMMQNTGGHIAADYARGNVADAEHPLFRAFLETLRDPKLGQAHVHLYDVAIWRSEALAATLPSDGVQDFDAAIAAARDAGDYGAVVALCVAARRADPDPHWLEIEAHALDTLGFARQAGYRRADAALAAEPWRLAA